MGLSAYFHRGFEVIRGNGISNPHDLAFSSWGELFVANPGPPFGNLYLGKTISRFLFDASGAAVPNGQVTASDLNGAIGLTFTPWDELFVSALSQPAQVARFTFDSSRAPVPHSLIAIPNTGGDIEFSNQCPLGQGNRAPGVNAGPDQSITLPDSAVLSASVADDNRPTATLAISWSQVAGPAAAVFADASQKSTSTEALIPWTGRTQPADSPRKGLRSAP